MLEIKNAPLFNGQQMLDYIASHLPPIHHAAIDHIEQTKRGWALIDAKDQTVIEAKRLVIAAGSGTPALLKEQMLNVL